jgi:CRP-like cAMP-binding protein
MIDKLRAHLVARLGSDVPELDWVLGHFHALNVSRGHDLLRQGEVCRFVYYLAQGALQVYSTDSNFNETTRDIVLEDAWCSELISFGQQQPALENIRTLEDSQLLAVSYESFQHLMATVPAFASVYKQILEVSYASSVQRVNSLVAMAALEKIQWLKAQRPQLLERVSSKLIASYLGMSQETYSRLKNKA